MNNLVLSALNYLPYFTIESVKQLWDRSPAKVDTIRIALHRWVKSGRVIRLKKGVYMTRAFFELHRNDPEFSAAVAAILLPQSYVSLEFVLQRHAILTEITYPVTAITPKNSRVILNSIGTFEYRHIKPELYHGYSISEYFGIRFAQASPAKALFDYLYLRPLSYEIRNPGYNLAEDLRLNLTEFSPSEKEEFSAYVSKSRRVKMMLILANLRNTVWQT